MPLSLKYSKIIDAVVNVECSGGVGTYCMRLSVAKTASGGADKTSQALYFKSKYTDHNVLTLGYSDVLDFGGSGEYGGSNSVGLAFNSGELVVYFTDRTYANGDHWNRIELKGKDYKISGYIIYE